jgi:uncharacterized glyoxalase superfamily protein PhnB
MKSPPPGWPRISSALFYDEPAKAIDWLCAAFGFEVRLKVVSADGGIAHSELVFGEGVIMVAGTRAPSQHGTGHRRSPRSMAGGNTQSLMLYVDDVEAHAERARRAGARIVSELETVDHGDAYWKDRGYEAEDPERHRWWFLQRLRNSGETGHKATEPQRE